MKRVYIFLLMLVLILSGCAERTMESENTLPYTDSYYGEVFYAKDIFAVIGLYQNTLLYLGNDEFTDQAGIYLLDLESGHLDVISELPDFHISPKESVSMDGVFYMTYNTMENGVKLLAIDTVQKSVEIIREWEQSVVTGNSVHCCAANEDGVYVLLRDSSGCSSVRKYLPESKGWDLIVNHAVQHIDGISLYGGELYALEHSTKADRIVHYDENGEPKEEWDIRAFAGLPVRESGVISFKYLSDCFYFQNASFNSYAFQLNGISYQALSGYEIAGDSSIEREVYVFFRRRTSEPLLLYSTEEKEIHRIAIDIPEGFIISGVWVDSDDSYRVLLSLYNRETGEKRMIIDSLKDGV